MPTEILAVGSTTANSADVVIDAGGQLTVCLKDADGGAISRDARCDILLKDDGGEYYKVAELNGRDPATIIVAAGTYRFTRIGGPSVGVFSG